MDQHSKGLKSKLMSLPKAKLRIISGVLFVLSVVLAYFSRQLVLHMLVSRMLSPPEYRYLPGLFWAAILVGIVALATLAVSFVKPKK